VSVVSRLSVACFVLGALSFVILRFLWIPYRLHLVRGVMFIDRVATCRSSPFGSAELLRLDQLEISALPNGDNNERVSHL